MYKITLFDMNSAPVSDRIATFFTDDIDDFEKRWVPLCKDDEERVERFRRSKAGENVTDYYTNLPVYNIVQKDPLSEVLHEKPIDLSDITFYATNAYGWQKQYHVDTWYCVFRWIRFRKHFYRIVSYKAVGVCMIQEDGGLKDVTCWGNRVLINTLKYIVEYDRGRSVADHPITYKDFADNTIETICWLTNACFKTRQNTEVDYKSFVPTDDILDLMFSDVIGEAG